jgi:NADP-dependent 3-hydroxy acid dehydrogenase YdfG
MNVMNFENRTALVTGASVGIGRATALKLAQHGAKLVLFDINYEKLESLKQELKEYTKDVLIYECDVSDEEKIYAYVKEAEEQFGEK